MITAIVGNIARRAMRITAQARVALVLALPISLSGLGACMSDPPTVQGSSAHIRIVQAVPNAPIVDLVVDDAAPVVTGLNFRSASGFLRVEAGTRRIRLTSTTPATTVLDESVFFEFPRALTVIATGMVGGVEGVVAPDTAPIPLPGEIALRVIQASQSAGTVDVYVTDENASLTTAVPVLPNLGFRGNSAYFTFPTGRYRVRLTTAGTKNVLYDLTQIYVERSMRTVVTFDATGGGLPVGGILLIDY